MYLSYGQCMANYLEVIRKSNPIIVIQNIVPIMLVCYSHYHLSTPGYYGLSNHGKHNEPCLIYTTFSNHIFIYYNITLPAVPSSNLFHTILQQTVRRSTCN